MFGITSKDADNLGAGLKICKKLRILKIYNSKMDDDKFYSVFDGIKNLTGLEILNFQNNMMTDESAETMVKLISGQPHLKKLDLTNNRFGCRQSYFIKSRVGLFLCGGHRNPYQLKNAIKSGGTVFCIYHLG